MKPHPRIRKTIKWGGAAVTVLLVAVWIASGWWAISWRGEDWTEVRLDAGTLKVIRYFGQIGGEAVVGLQAQSHSFRMSWSAGPLYSIGSWCLPLWATVLIAASLTSSAWRLDSRARRRAGLNLCPKCNYDRAGLAAGVKCPECGAIGGVPTSA